MTRANLIWNLSTKQPGALANADGKHVIAEELNNADKRQLASMYELLSDGRTVVPGNENVVIESRFGLLAFANPEDGVFTNGDASEQLGFAPQLLSRFGIVTPMDRLDEDQLRRVVRAQWNDRRPRGIPQHCREWIRLARMFEPGVAVSDRAMDAFVDQATDIIRSYTDHPLRRDTRVATYLRRLARVSAQARFTDIGDENLEEALAIYEEALAAWDRV